MKPRSPLMSGARGSRESAKPFLLLAFFLVLNAPVEAQGKEKPRDESEGKIVFHVPFPPGVTYRVLFGPGDPPHHLSARNRHAYDFDMPYGSEVSAAASGDVVKVRSHFSGPTGRSQENNYIAIRHATGQVSEYHHLLQDGVLVRVGERVERGEVIGFSGASGRAEGAHLHFVVVRGEASVPVKFKECGASAKKGERCTSRNVPAALEKDHRKLEETGRVASVLENLRAPVRIHEFLARETLASLASEEETARLRGARISPSRKRSLMALRPCEEKIRTHFAEILGQQNSGGSPK